MHIILELYRPSTYSLRLGGAKLLDHPYLDVQELNVYIIYQARVRRNGELLARWAKRGEDWPASVLRSPLSGRPLASALTCGPKYTSCISQLQIDNFNALRPPESAISVPLPYSVSEVSFRGTPVHV